MHRLIGLRLEDLVIIHNPRIVVNGAPEPEWLRRNAEIARELPLLLAERKLARAADEPKGIVARLRLALGRA
jgi:hypothetical protein